MNKIKLNNVEISQEDLIKEITGNKELMETLKAKNVNNEVLYPLFTYTNEPIIKKELIENQPGYGKFPNRAWKLTYENGEFDYASQDTIFSDTPFLESSRYIVRQSEPLNVLQIYETMIHGYIVKNLLSEQFYYIPKYNDLLGLGNNKEYKHPKLLSTQPSQDGVM